MAKVIGGIGASHSPAIAFAKDTNKSGDPGWVPIFAGFREIQRWVDEKKPDVLFMIFNDHVTSFFFDHYSAFSLGVDTRYATADEGGGARDYPAVKGHSELARHVGAAMVADEFDMSFFQNKPLDHGCFSPLSMVSPDVNAWPGTIVPLQVGVLQFPVPNARRCYKLGKTLRRAIQSFPDDDLKVAIVGTGGLSHQVHGERCGFNNTQWDDEFLELLEHDPMKLTNIRLADYAALGGVEGAEVIMWLIMRGALSEKVKKVYASTYLPSMTNIATVIFEDLGEEPAREEIEAYRVHINYELAGLDKLEGTHPFTLERSVNAFRINNFLHRLILPEHRERFLSEPDPLFDEFGLTEEERTMIRGRKLIEMVHYGVSFFLLEKMAAVIGQSNLHVYASMRGEGLEAFQKTRNVPMQYSVAGGARAKSLDAQSAENQG